MKPRIYRSQGRWWCTGIYFFGHGTSPDAAYWAWAWLSGMPNSDGLDRLDERLGNSRGRR